MKSMQEKLEEFLKRNGMGGVYHDAPICSHLVSGWWAGAAAMAECLAVSQQKESFLDKRIMHPFSPSDCFHNVSMDKPCRICEILYLERFGIEGKKNV